MHSTARDTPAPHGRVALVTGAARGIGRAVARDLLVHGYRVFALDRDAEALTEFSDTIAPEYQADHITHVADVADEHRIRRAFDALDSHFGQLDLLVNNAGLADPFNGPIESLELADWNRVIGINLTGYFLCTKHAVPRLRPRGGGIVNIASTRAYQSEAQTEAYAASKGGIVALTHALAVSLGPAIRVNAIAPGWIDGRAEQPDSETPAPLRAIDHEQHPAGRVGRGEDIAAWVRFLASPDSGFVTGQTMIADGGMTRRMIYAH